MRFYVGVLTISYGSSWTAEAVAAPVLALDESLQVDDCLHSVNGRFHACLRKGGSLVVSESEVGASSADRIVYTTGLQTPSKAKKLKATISDGRFIIHEVTEKKGAEPVLSPVWSSGTSTGDYLYLHDDGRLSLYDAGLIWDTEIWKQIPPPPPPPGGSYESCASGEAQSSLVDPSTGVSMPIDSGFGASILKLIGLGVRAKALVVVNVNVYTVGLYVDAKGAGKALQQWVSRSPELVAKDANFYSTLMEGSITKYLDLHFVRSVTAEKVVSALTSVEDVPPDTLSAFSVMLLKAIGGTIEKNESIILGWEAAKDKFVVMVRGKVAGELKNAKQLSQAIFKIYLGSNPVSAAMKADVSRHLSFLS